MTAREDHVTHGSHTPGPWRVGQMADSVVAEDGTNLARSIGPYSRGGGAPHDERAANAKLIAAAPDLLAACRAAVASGGLEGANLTNALSRCRAAVEKATGGHS